LLKINKTLNNPQNIVISPVNTTPGVATVTAKLNTNIKIKVNQNRAAIYRPVFIIITWFCLKHQKVKFVPDKSIGKTPTIVPSAKVFSLLKVSVGTGRGVGGEGIIRVRDI